MLGCMIEADVQVSVMVLVVSSLFPRFLSPSCLSEGGGEGPFSHSCREQRSTFSLTREKSNRGSGLSIASASPGHTAEEDELLQSVKTRGAAVGGAGALLPAEP